MDSDTANPKDPLTILTTVFNHQSFRSNQKEIIENVLSQKNTLAILPTGAGKSLCFQIPALIFDGLTVVVSPLIALMKDQVDNLEKKGVFEVAYINSMLDQSTKESVYEQLKESKLKMLYVAPETFVDNKLLSILKLCTISLIAIDEVHCISIWGHNFRPDYLRLRQVIKELGNPPPPILGLTATATKTVEEDIQRQLDVECDVFKDSFDRKNLLFSVLILKSNLRKEEILKAILEKLKGSTIVYVNFTRTAEDLATYLADAGLSASYYHGQIEDKEERRKIQNDFISGRTRIVVATNAFGMGIDKEDIRAIIHYNLPKSIENYYQEVGRAGRDQNIANCILLYSKEDEIKLRKLIERNTPTAKQIKAVLDLLMNEKVEDELIHVNIKRLANDLKLDEVPIRLILHHLERTGAIKTHFKIFRRAKIRLINSKVESSRYGQETERIIRSEYFKENLNRWMDLEELSNSAQLPIPRTNNVLRGLKAAGKIELIEGDVCIPIKINHAINEVNAGEIHDIFLRLEESSMNKIDKVVDYVRSEGCKRKFILNYFGDEYSGVCNACSVCNPFLKIGEGIKAKEELEDSFRNQSDKSTKIAFDIFELLKDLDFPVGRTFLANVLIGSKSKQIINQNLQESRYYGILKGYTADEVKYMVDQLIEAGYLEKRQGDSRFPRPVVYLTDMAERALREKGHIKLRMPVKAKEEVVISEGKGLKVLADLKKWRREIASEKNIPPYCVFHDSTLIGIAKQLPKTREELEAIKGIGKRRIEVYGDDVLKIVKGCDELSLPANVESEKKASSPLDAWRIK